MQEGTPLITELEEQNSRLCCEKTVECCVETPGICLPFRSLSEHMFRRMIQTKECVNENPIIAFRADTRFPEEIFKTGFSAYSKCRPGCFCCNDKSKVAVCLLCAPLCLPIGMIACLLSYCIPSCPEWSPGNFTGGNQTRTLFISNYSALALTKHIDSAYGWYAESSTQWKYIVYLEKGYIDFDKFCKLKIARGYDAEPEPDGYGATPAHSAGEIFPNGRQRVSAKHIIAAVPSNVSLGDKIVLNPNSIFYERLRHLNSPSVQAIVNICEEKQVVKEPAQMQGYGAIN